MDSNVFLSLNALLSIFLSSSFTIISTSPFNYVLPYDGMFFFYPSTEPHILSLLSLPTIAESFSLNVPNSKKIFSRTQYFLFNFFHSTFSSLSRTIFEHLTRIRREK